MPCCAAAGVGVLSWGAPSLRLASAVWLGLLGVVVALSKGEMFFHALVLVVAVGAGVSAAVLGCLAYVRAG